MQLYRYLNLGFSIDFNYPFLHGMNMDLIRVSITKKVRVCNNALKIKQIQLEWFCYPNQQTKQHFGLRKVFLKTNVNRPCDKQTTNFPNFVFLKVRCAKLFSLSTYSCIGL